MLTLYLLRHAKSSRDDPSLADHERPLAPRGRRDATRIAEHLASTGCEPDFVLCSSAARTRETLDLLQLAAGDATVAVEDELYAASAETLLARIRRVPDDVETVMLIGHNPAIHELALELLPGGDDRERLEAKFPTAAVATLVPEDTWSRLAPGGATLAAFVVPKQLR